MPKLNTEAQNVTNIAFEGGASGSGKTYVWIDLFIRLGLLDK